MAMDVKQQLLEMLQDLREKELKSFQWYLQDPDLLDGFPAIKKIGLDTSTRKETVDLMVHTYTTKDAVAVMNLIMKKIKKNQEEALNTFDLKKHSASEEALLRLLPQVKTSKKALLGGCSLSERSCKALSSLLSSESCNLSELDLSNNDLQDSGLKLLSAGLANPQCKLETLSLSGCLITEEGCTSLASALSSNPFYLRVLDLSYNHPGDSGVKLLKAGLENPQWRLETLRVEPAGVRWLRPAGQRKYFSELNIDANTLYRTLRLSNRDRRVTYMEEDRPYPDHPDRFEWCTQLLCRNGLTGRCYWEVEWRGKVHIAVSYRGIRRRGNMDCVFGWNDQSWSLDCSNAGCYSVWHNNKGTPVSCSSVSNRVAVYVDCPAGTLSFYRVSSDTLIHLHTFNTTFTEPLYPGFGFWSFGSSVFLCSDPRKTQPTDTGRPSNRVDDGGPTNPSTEKTCDPDVRPVPDTQPDDNTEQIKVPVTLSASPGLQGSPEMTGSGHLQKERPLMETRQVIQVTSSPSPSPSPGERNSVEEVELLYRTVQWDERILQSASKMAAGPLFNIESSEDAVCRLHLPHCGTKEALLSGCLSVVHIFDEGMDILKPLKITDTHVIVEVPHLSSLGAVWDIMKRLWKNATAVSGQVLLFLRPTNPKTQRQNLNVFLLPSSVPVEEVSVKHRHCDYIPALSNCEFIKDHRYSVLCPTAYKVQPLDEKFHLDFGPNYHPTFEIRLPSNTEEVSITVRDQTQRDVWKRDVDLTDIITNNDNLPTSQGLPADKRLLSVRKQFVNKVSESILNQLLDSLLQHGIINEEEMDSAKIKPKAERARAVMDLVRSKGDKASSSLITDLRELDPHLSKTLNLS